MYSITRTELYGFVYDLVYDEEVCKNVYLANEPQELTESDVNDGFVVIRIGSVSDDSEFTEEAYGRVRVYIEAYVPPKSRGRLDTDKMLAYEDAISLAVRRASQSSDGFAVLEDSMLSSDIYEETNANNQYFVFIKSFVVLID